MRRAGHSDSVTVAAVDGRGLRCVSGSDDGTCRVFDLASGAASHVLRLPEPPSAVVLRGQACLVSAGDRAHLFDLVGARPAVLHVAPLSHPTSLSASLALPLSLLCPGRALTACAAHPPLVCICSWSRLCCIREDFAPLRHSPPPRF